LRISGTNLLHQQATETATYTDASGRTLRITNTQSQAAVRIMLEHQL
jgi:hypothetical protein